MPAVTFVLASGETKTLHLHSGQSLMLGAVTSLIDGIVGTCGGMAACGTCHVYVDPEWHVRLIPAAPSERDLIQFVPNARDTSRLSCQIALGEPLDGLVVHVPESQY